MHNQDVDNCDATVCCAQYVSLTDWVAVVYTPLVTMFVPFERYQKLPDVVIPIFSPPQNFV